MFKYSRVMSGFGHGEKTYSPDHRFRFLVFMEDKKMVISSGLNVDRVYMW